MYMYLYVWLPCVSFSEECSVCEHAVEWAENEYLSTLTMGNYYDTKLRTTCFLGMLKVRITLHIVHVKFAISYNDKATTNNWIYHWPRIWAANKSLGWLLRPEGGYAIASDKGEGGKKSAMKHGETWRCKLKDSWLPVVALYGT